MKVKQNTMEKRDGRIKESMQEGSLFTNAPQVYDRSR